MTNLLRSLAILWVLAGSLFRRLNKTAIVVTLLTASPGLLSAQVTVNISSPVANSRIDTLATVVVTVASTYEVVSVTGSIGGKSSNFAYSATAICFRGGYCIPGWVSSFNLNGLTRGAYTLDVIARDALANTGRASVAIIYDARPRLTVKSPKWYSVATPALEIEATCLDDDAGCRVEVKEVGSIPSLTLLSGVGGIKGTVTLPHRIGQQARISISATDSANQNIIETLDIPVVDVSAGLTPLGMVPGLILDATPDRILYFDNALNPPALKIRDRLTLTDATIYTAPEANIRNGYLHSVGAIFQDSQYASGALYDFRAGTLTLLSSRSDFSANGNYAVFRVGNIDPNLSDLYVRDLTVGSNRLVAAGLSQHAASVATNGSVAYMARTSNSAGGYIYTIYFWKDGASRQVSSNVAGFGDLRIDGGSVVYCTGQAPASLILWSDGRESTLSGGNSSGCGNYLVSGGYVAFTVASSSGVQQVWRRNPSGLKEQITFFSANSRPDTISAQGDVTIRREGGLSELFLSRAGASLVELPKGLSSRLWQGTELYGYLSGSLFSIGLAGRVNGTTYLVSASAVPQTAGTVSCTPAQVPHGSSSICTATANTGYAFTGWGGACSGQTAPTCSLIEVTSTKNVEAGFALNALTIGIQPSALAFGEQPVGSGSSARTLTVTNSGLEAFAYTSIFFESGIGSDQFSASHSCSSVAPSASCIVSVVFNPTAFGPRTGNLRVQTNRGDRTVEVTGTGVASLNFDVNVGAAVRGYYERILGRAPDSSGSAFWSNEASRLVQLGADIREVFYTMAMQFFGSAEYRARSRTDAQFIGDLYQTFFNRQADSAGSAYWQGELAAVQSRSALLNSFLFSPEFTDTMRGIFGSASVRPEINMTMDLFRGAFGRLPDSDGYNFYLTQLRTAQCGGSASVGAKVSEIADTFFSSQEYTLKARTNPDFMGDVYNTYLRRGPGGDSTGFNYWVSETPRRGRDAVRGAFIPSPEFQNRVAAVVAAGCL